MVDPFNQSIQRAFDRYYILTVLAFLLESRSKLRILRAAYQHVNREQVIGFRGRNLYL
jgi:hypothetical protein